MTVQIKAPKGLSAKKREAAQKLMAELQSSLTENPLFKFHSCPVHCGEPGCRPHPKQHEFMAARTHVQAAFAGNRFGKSSALIVKAAIQHLPTELVPKRLRQYKLAKSRVVSGRIVCPSEQVMMDNMIPAMKQWIPRQALRGGSWDKAWDKRFNMLHFENGGRIGLYTYKQDPSTMEGVALDYVAYDEPPPKSVREACASRLADRDGFEMFAMTPVNMEGGGIGYIYREIFKKREHPDVTVVTGSGFDNPSIPKQALERMLSTYDDLTRRAREFGEFVNIGGMVYPGGFDHCLIDPLTPEQVQRLDTVVGIDPGLKCAAFVWIGFDRDNRAFVYDEAMIENGTPNDYAEEIKMRNKRWGVRDPMYVIDPSAQNRSLATGDNVESLLMQLGIYTVHANNAVEAGVQQVRKRMQDEAFFVSRECRYLRDEAEEYRMEDTPDGAFKVVKEMDHFCDSTRYGVMSRLWMTGQAEQSKRTRLGYVQDHEGPYRPGVEEDGSPVLGAYS